MFAIALLGIALGVPIWLFTLAAGAMALPFFTAMITGSTLELPARNDSGPGV